MRQKIVAGNWKMNKTLNEGLDFIENLQQVLEGKGKQCKIIIAPPFIHLASISSILKGDIIKLSSQNIADKEKGAFTGEVSAQMVRSTGAEYSIIGHSERRQYYHENGEILREKIDRALNNDLIPIFCVGESLKDREENSHFEIVSKQLKESLFHLSAQQFNGMILAYEPIWAIGTGKTASPEDANEMHIHIRREISKQFGEEIASNTSILYGGSCNSSNAEALFSMSDIDGGLIGGASLEWEKFKLIIESFR